MALLKITCSGCQHDFFRIVVACNREGVDMVCPACGEPEGTVHVMETGTKASPFAPCSHVREENASSEASQATATPHEHE